jgi:aminoglycoside phosphotransferase (APT) family kinase protein
LLLWNNHVVSESLAASEFDGILDVLLETAGVAGPLRRREEVSHPGATNRTWVVETEQGSRYVFRVYRRLDEPGDSDRIRREALLRRLRRHGIPVPEVLAAVEDRRRSAALFEYLPGELLDDVTERVDAEARNHAWRAVGQMLAHIHSIIYPDGTAGVVVGEGVCPFEAGSWREFSCRDTLQHAARLRQRLPGLGINVDRLQEIAELVGPSLDAAPSVLLHNDPHPWNVLVRETDQGWECSGWLDWEHAWVGDPVWDLVRMDLFRRKPIGATPDAFWDGYGGQPSEPRRSFYELQINLWMANQFLDGSVALPPTYQAAIGYVAGLDDRLSHLERLVN